MVGLAAIAAGLLLMLVSGAQAGDDGAVHRVEVTGEIDLGLAPFLDRALADARAADAAAVLIEIDTPGGRLDAVLQMRDALLRTPVPTIAFVEGTAFSAGALVALASEQVHLAPAATIGAATPVDGGTGAPADEKVVAAVRSTFRATAEERGRDPRLAEAMVDPDVEVEGVVDRGELLSMTAPEAVEAGIGDSLVADREELLAALDLADATLVEADPSLAERLVRVITNPVLAGLLLTLGMWLVLGDLLSGGVGLATVVGGGLLAVFLWGHLLAGLAGWEDVVLVLLGVVLLLVEVFVVPGFGVAGLLGLASLLGGSFLAMLNRDFDVVGTDELVRAGTVVGVSFLAIVGGTVAIVAHLARHGGPRGLVLRSRLGVAEPVTDRAGGGWLRWFGAGGGVLASEHRAGERSVHGDGERPVHHDGARSPTDAPDGRRDDDTAGMPGRLVAGTPGTARSDLRPSGVAEIDGQRVDVVTDGEYLRAGEEIEVVRDEGYRRVVRRRRR
jgi:membrane-bound serine protease (ClpP class)